MRRFILSILFLLNTHFCLYSQRLHFNALTVQDGLSQNDVSSIIQDSEGFIWFGTYDGLNRFDGYRIENFFHDNQNMASLSSNRILCLFEDNKKRIWSGTDGYGLNYYNLENGKMKRVAVPDGFKIINYITQNKEGDLLAATAQGLLKIVEKKDEIFSVEILQSPLTGFNIKSIKFLKNGNVMYATENGLWLFQNNNFKFVSGSEDMLFRSIVETKNGAIWVGSSNGLYELVDNKLIHFEALRNVRIPFIVEGTNNDLWITTFSKGLYHLDLNNKNFIKIEAFNDEIQHSLARNNLNYLYKDATNTLWIANKIGVVYINLDDKKFKSLPISEKKLVRTIFTTNEDLIYGLQGDKYYKFNFKTQVEEPILLPENSKPFRVDTLNGKIHLATTNGLFKEANFDKNTFERVPIFKDSSIDKSLIITSFCKDKFGNEYIGTLKGLIYKTKSETAFINEKQGNLESLRNVRVFTLKVDAFNQCVWVGTISEGLFKINLDPQGKILSMERYHEDMVGAYNIPNNSVWSFYQNKVGTLYIGTDTGLLVKKVNQAQMQPVVNENIQNKKILGIVGDANSDLWINSSKGIIWYSPKENISKKYNIHDGLLTNSFTEAISKNSHGELFFGNILGINYFKSGEFHDNPFPSKIAFTKLVVNNQEVAVNEEIADAVLLAKTLNNTQSLDFNHKQNDFTIQFSSTNYANVKVNQYRYKLKNYDDDWIEVNNNNRFANYSNIPSGNYKFVVEATNPTGQWSGLQRSIAISIQPAPWNTWWAYLFYFIFTATIVFTIFYFWLNKEKLRNQVELSKFKSEQEKEVNELKLVFFTDIAHEFKTPLSLIIGPIEDLIRGNISPKHREFCHNILSRNTNRMLNLINQLLDFRKINSGVNILKVSRNDICSQLTQIAGYFDWEAENSNISLRIIAPENYYCHFDRDILEKVIFNVLSNAFKYTPFGGTIEIELKPTWKNDLEYVIILIKDSGKGIPQEDKRKIFERHFHGKERSSSGIGLHLSATLIKAHKGEINVSNSSLGGTEFMITLPVSSKAFEAEEYLFEDDIAPITKNNYVPGDTPEILDEAKDDLREKILIVEDDHDLRKYLKNILLYDYKVIEAANGKEGLEVCLRELPDMIITDVMMPELDGIEFCKLVKKNIVISHIPILMLTAKTGEEFSEIGFKAGAWDYIPKPFNSSQLLQKVKNISETRNNFRQLIMNGSVEKTENHYVSFDQKFIQNAKEIIAYKITDPEFTVEALSNELGLSRMQLHRKLNTLIGQSSTAFINSIRIEKAINMFDNGCDRVQEAMDAVGITSYAHFIILFKKEKEMTPKKYIEQLKNAVVK